MTNIKNVVLALNIVFPRYKDQLGNIKDIDDVSLPRARVDIFKFVTDLRLYIFINEEHKVYIFY